MIDGVSHTFDLRQHAAGNDTGRLVALDLGDFDLGDQGGFIVLVIEQTDNIRHADEFFCMQGDGDLRRSRVGVDVVGDAVVVHADGGNDRDEAVGQQMLDQRGIHLFDLAHIAQVHIRLAAAGDGVAIHAAQANAAAFQQGDEVLVDLARQHLLYDAHGLLIGVAQAAHKLGLLAHAGQHLVDGRAAAVDQHHSHAQQGQGDQVVHDGQFQLIVDHSVAAVLDDKRFAVVFLDIGRSFAEKQRHLFIFHCTFPPVPGLYQVR